MRSPTAPSSSENDRGRRNTYSITSAIATAAASASNTVITATRVPFPRSVVHLKYLPTPKAMNASATSVTNPMLSTMSAEIHFSPQGPMSMPANM